MDNEDTEWLSPLQLSPTIRNTDYEGMMPSENKESSLQNLPTPTINSKKPSNKPFRKQKQTVLKTSTSTN